MQIKRSQKPVESKNQEGLGMVVVAVTKGRADQQPHFPP